eukprot:scaffold38177_cov46-Cyclotella_meneghiniana.AAC.2
MKIWNSIIAIFAFGSSVVADPGSTRNVDDGEVELASGGRNTNSTQGDDSCKERVDAAAEEGHVYYDLLKSCEGNFDGAHNRAEHLAKKVQDYEEAIQAAKTLVEFYADKAQAYKEDIDRFLEFERMYGDYYYSCIIEQKCPSESVEMNVLIAE